MGRLLEACVDELRVTQNYLLERQVKNYFNISDISNIPPIPVAHDMIQPEKYCVLDGHHYLASMRLKRINTVPLWLCDSPNESFSQLDTNSYDSAIIEDRAREIEGRFMTAPFYVPMIGGQELFTIDELITQTLSPKLWTYNLTSVAD